MVIANRRVSLTLLIWVIHLVHGHHAKWQLETNDCLVTDAQWNLITWYFDRAPFIELTEIVDTANDENRSRYADDLANHMSMRMTKLLKTQTVNLSANEGYVTETQLYGWRGARFEHRFNASKTLEDNLYVERETVLTIENRTSKMPEMNRARIDVPIFGSLVVVDSTHLLDDYLFGYPRQPFNHPRASFIILVFGDESDAIWEMNASKLMARLWKMYSILDVIIISTCKAEEVGYYDPFVNVQPNMSASMLEGWGVFRWVPINSIDDHADWLLQKGNTFNGYPMTITMFSRNPTAVRSDDLPEAFLSTHYARGIDYSNGFGGFDGLVLGNMAQVLHFEALVVQPLTGTYGNRRSDGSYSGSIGDVLYGRSDASFNGRFIQEYDSDEIEFMYAVNADQMCVIAPAAERIPQWMAIFKCFHLYVWISLPIVTCLCGVFWFLLKLWAYSKRQFTGLTERWTFYEILVQILMVLLGASILMPMRSMERFFVGSCLMANVIIIGTFQGSLTTSFSTVSYYKNLQTLQDLDKSGLKIVTSSESLRTLFGFEHDASPLLKSLIRKFQIFEIDNPIQRTAYKRDMCSVERYSDINIIIKTTYQRPDGSAFVHVINECPRHYFLAYIVKKGWPFLSCFNYMLIKFSEAGLLNVWYEQVERAFVMHHLISNQFDVYKTQAFTFHDIQTAFYILGIGLVGCVFVFIVEVFIFPPKNKHFRTNKNNRMLKINGTRTVN